MTAQKIYNYTTSIAVLTQWLSSRGFLFGDLSPCHLRLAVSETSCDRPTANQLNFDTQLLGRGSSGAPMFEIHPNGSCWIVGIVRGITTEGIRKTIIVPAEIVKQALDLDYFVGTCRSAKQTKHVRREYAKLESLVKKYSLPRMTLL